MSGGLITTPEDGASGSFVEVVLQVSDSHQKWNCCRRIGPIGLISGAGNDRGKFNRAQEQTLKLVDACIGWAVERGNRHAEDGATVVD